MNYMSITKHDIANGPGVRVVLWVSGCRCHCKNCHNQDTWDFNAGNMFNDSTMKELCDALDHEWISGLTLSGGHPLEYENLPAVYDIVKYVKSHFPNKTIWLYTGYILSERDFDTSADICWDNSLLQNHILAMCDVVVDGPYIEEQKDISLLFRGSKNQRLIDVKKTIKQNKIVLYNN